MSPRVWRFPIVNVWVCSYNDMFRTPLVARLGRDYFELPLSYDAFTTGPSDYVTVSNEIYCPCGVTLPWPSGDVGELLWRIDDHCRATLDHPAPVRSEPF